MARQSQKAAIAEERARRVAANPGLVMPQVQTEYIDEINVGDRRRPIDSAKVMEIAKSIEAIGLQQPITVMEYDDADNDEFTLHLIAGNHRLAACKSLGWGNIPCIVVDMDEIDRELWEIDENLMRAELTPAQEARHLSRRKELWGKRNSGQSSPINKGRPKEFAGATSEQTGMAKRTINQAISRAENIDPAAMEALQGTSLDKGVELDALKKLSPDEQIRLAEQARAGEDVTARVVVAFPDAKPAPKGFVQATQLIGNVHLFAQFCKTNAPANVAGGVLEYEVSEVTDDVAVIRDWLRRFKEDLAKP